MIKYQYAKDETDRLIDIDNLNEKDRNNSKFFCVGCGNELVARLGRIKVHHFAHKKVVTCSGETYLHLLGKQLFFDNYLECLTNNKPFLIEIYQKNTCNHYEQDFNLKCKLEKNTTQFDLTKHFDKISIEERESSFIADVMLTSKSGNEKVFIEIAVTHLCSEQKLNSSYRIIEIGIKKEDDLEPIKKKLLSINDSKVKFKNFKTKDINASFCNGNCKIVHNFLTLDKDGRCLLKQRNLKQIKHQLTVDNDNIVKFEILNGNSYNYSEIFKSGVAIFVKNKMKVRNCFICRYHAENNSWQFEETSNTPIFCKFLKIKCNSNNAVTCDYFKLEQNYVNALLMPNEEHNMKINEYYSGMKDV